MNYPSNWIKNETQFGTTPVILATFNSPETNSKNKYIAEVRLKIDDFPSSSVNEFGNPDVNEYSRSVIMNYTIHPSTNIVNFKVIGSDSYAQLAGQNAYKFVFTFTDIGTGINYEGIETGTVVGSGVGSKVYTISAKTDADQYSNYLPTYKR